MSNVPTSHDQSTYPLQDGANVEIAGKRRPGLVRTASINLSIRKFARESELFSQIKTGDEYASNESRQSSGKDSRSLHRKVTRDNLVLHNSSSDGNLLLSSARSAISAQSSKSNDIQQDSEETEEPGMLDTILSAPAALFSMPFVLTSGVHNVVSSIMGSAVETIGDSVPTQLMSSGKYLVDVSLDNWLDSDIGKALHHMSMPPHIFKHIRVLFVQLYDSLDNIKVNIMRNSIAQFKIRLGEFVLALGSPTDSVLQRLQLTADSPLPPSALIRAIEDALSRAWIYFSRFNKPNALLHLLVSSDLPSFMYAYDFELAKGCRELIESTSQFASVSLLWNLNISATPLYRPHCNLLQYLSNPDLNSNTGEEPLSEGIY